MYSLGSSERNASSMRKGSSRRCRSCVSTRVSRTPAPSEVACPATCRSSSRDCRIVADVMLASVPPLQDLHRLLESEARAAGKQFGRITVADIHEEIRFDSAIREELAIDLLVVEARHWSRVQTQGAGSENQVGAL